MNMEHKEGRHVSVLATAVLRLWRRGEKAARGGGTKACGYQQALLKSSLGADEGSCRKEVYVYLCYTDKVEEALVSGTK